MDFTKVIDAVAGFLKEEGAPLPGIDREEILGYFRKAGLEEKYDEIRRSIEQP